MSENRNQENFSLQDLEKQKLQAEIDILRAKLATEYPLKDEGNTGWVARLAIHVKGWSAFILGAVTLISAVWGVFVPLSEYLVEQRKALEYELNENMIGFVDDLNSEDPAIANRGVMMLSYYEVNSIPILLFFLEGSGNEKEEFREKIVETISLIYVDSGDKSIMEIILRKMQGLFEETIVNYGITENEIDQKKRIAILNYLDLISKMNLTSTDRDEVTGIYRGFKSNICNHTKLDEFEVFGIFEKICLFLGEDISCE